MSKALPFIIKDGYTRTVKVEAVPGIHEEMSFTYRPLLTEERDEWLEKLDRTKIKAAAATKRIIELLADKVKSWSLTDPETSEPLKLDYETIRLVVPRLLDRMYLIVLGNEGGDDGLSENERQEEDLKN